MNGSKLYGPSGNRSLSIVTVALLGVLGGPLRAENAPKPADAVLKAESFRHYIEDFNQNDHELYLRIFPNAAAWDFLKDNIPLLDCPDENIQTTYYFRWWTYRKHLKQTPGGFIVDEFLPNVGWAGKYNSISCAAGHHLYEGRWLRNPKYLDDYSRFWFRGGGEPRRYSFWAADSIGTKDYFELLKIYAQSHRLKRDDGRVVPWIDENLNPTNGDWISRTRLKNWKNGTWDAGKGGEERGQDYNHSTYCDLVISGLIGLRPRADDAVEVNPLVPEGWDWFCLDRVFYHGQWLTILFDRTGQHYRKGKGLRVFAGGKEIAAGEKIARVTGKLPAAADAVDPETSAGWKKFAGNPVLGGQFGTCFDISVLREGSTYRMWLSWRPKKSVALVESQDGIHWSEPPQIVLGPRGETGWENDINRPFVLKRGGTCHMWYTGQVKPGARDGHSWIGYATSPDGVTWKRMSDKPVLSFDQPWEKVAVMCPSVIWDESAQLFRMWYSGGEQNEPNAIGYATSPDGLTWTKNETNPVFSPDPNSAWEKHKVTACQVEKRDGWHLMFYIGFRDEEHAQIGIARSRNGITNWQRHPANPIVRPGENKWDHNACYKPFAIFDGAKWLLWYNGRRGGLEQIGVVRHDGEDLGFP